MFTGLVEEKGALVSRTLRGPGARVTVGCTMAPLVLGESISVDGVCLTVDVITDRGFEADCSRETLDRTTLGSLALGAPVNLERALALGARLGGHIVSGHVDGVGELLEKKPVGDAVQVDFQAPKELARYLAEKGSIAINGVSLTLNGVRGDRFDVTLIPHTLHKTSLGALKPGSPVNLEVDVLARYVARLLEFPPEATRSSPQASTDGAWLERLKTHGFT